MEDQLILFPLATLAKEIGFEEPCDHYFTASKTLWSCYEMKNSNSPNIISAPTQSLLARWFREKHGVVVLPLIDERQSINLIWKYVIYDNSPDIMKFVILRSIDTFETFELAYEAGLYAAGEYIKEQQLKIK